LLEVLRFIAELLMLIWTSSAKKLRLRLWYLRHVKNVWGQLFVYLPGMPSPQQRHEELWSWGCCGRTRACKDERALFQLRWESPYRSSFRHNHKRGKDL